MNSPLVIPKEFWQELEEVYRAEAQADDEENEEEKEKLVIPPEFWKELQAVYETELKAGAFKYDPGKEPAEKVLAQLQEALDKIVQKATEEVNAGKKKYSDSPLFLPFSLFEPMSRGRDEVHYTKTLAWFMDGKQSHGFKQGVLTTLLPLFLGQEAIPADGCCVEAEKWGDEECKNRFDIKLSGKLKDEKPFSILIEAKVDADEGEKQLARYERNLSDETVLVFLTPDGRNPETAEKKKKWHAISWREIALRLMRYLEGEEAKKAEAYHLLRFFVASIIRNIEEINSTENMVATAIYINSLKEDIHD